ncbi:MAG TPA: ABC transporter substrate-binding protein [Candidatus Acidoferrales bacterium]|nr:ABC transporter substrate-binding protein [Candidatus Acidoferrales bacterium]
MRTRLDRILPLCTLFGALLFAALSFAAQPNAALLKAKKDGEAKGYIFETSHEEIVAKAKKDGRLKVLTGLDPASHAPMIQSFKKKYPFMESVEIYEIDNTDASQRVVSELKAGRGREWDVAYFSSEFYSEYPPLAKKFDILGMAEHGVLKISPKMVEPKHRTIVALGSTISVSAYNKKLIAPEKVPNRWEDFLRPDLKGKKFLVEVIPYPFAAFAACPEEGLGLEWGLRLARGLRDQEPIWIRGNTRALTAMIAGEYALHFATHYQSVVRAMAKDPTGSLQAKIIEPVPVRLTEIKMVLGSASHPYAGLLFIEHEASPEGQAIIDKYGPLKGSLFVPGSALAKAVEGKKLCVSGFDEHGNHKKWMAMAVEAFGFPNAEKGR